MIKINYVPFDSTWRANDDAVAEFVKKTLERAMARVDQETDLMVPVSQVSLIYGFCQAVALGAIDCRKIVFVYKGVTATIDPEGRLHGWDWVSDPADLLKKAIKITVSTLAPPTPVAVAAAPVPTSCLSCPHLPK